MKSYLVAALVAAAALFGGLYWHANNKLASVQGDLSMARAVNAENARAMADMARSAEITDKVTAGWNRDRTTLAGVRNAARQTIKETLRANNESFRDWADTMAPPDAWGVLRNESLGADQYSDPGSAGGTAGRLPGNVNPFQRH